MKYSQMTTEQKLCALRKRLDALEAATKHVVERLETLETGHDWLMKEPCVGCAAKDDELLGWHMTNVSPQTVHKFQLSTAMSSFGEPEWQPVSWVGSPPQGNIVKDENGKWVNKPSDSLQQRQDAVHPKLDPQPQPAPVEKPLVQVAWDTIYGVPLDFNSDTRERPDENEGDWRK